MPHTAGGMDGGALSQTQVWSKELGTHAIALTTEDGKRRHSTALAAPQKSVRGQLSYAVRGLGKGIYIYIYIYKFVCVYIYIILYLLYI